MNYTFSPDTCRKLETLKIKPIYRVKLWYSNADNWDLIDDVRDKYGEDMYPIPEKTVLSYTVFDLLIPENARLVWGDGEKYDKTLKAAQKIDPSIDRLELPKPMWIKKQSKLLTLIQQGQSIESIERFVNENCSR